MSSSKPSSSKEPKGKRKSDKTTDDHGKIRGSRDQGSSSKGKKVKKSDTLYHDVYIVKLDTDRNGSDYHRSLLVEFSEEPSDHAPAFMVSRGDIFEAVGPYQVSKTLCKFQFARQRQKAPENSLSFVSKRLVGSIASHRLDGLHEVCKHTRTPSGRLGYEGRPDCSDWLQNVLFKLNQKNIIEFTSDYSPPTKEASMMDPGAPEV